MLDLLVGAIAGLSGTVRLSIGRGVAAGGVGVPVVRRLALTADQRPVLVILQVAVSPAVQLVWHRHVLNLHVRLQHDRVRVRVVLLLGRGRSVGALRRV